VKSLSFPVLPAKGKKERGSLHDRSTCNLFERHLTMSAAAQVAPRKVTDGWCQIPNSLIENARTLTAAEFYLSLIVLRKDKRHGPVVLTAKNWQEWTGLSPRMMDYATAGLTQKGLLKVEGRGDKATYAFDDDKWETYLRTAAPEERPKTQGRKAVKPVAAKPGAMVHPECAHECALLKQDRQETKGGITLVPAPVPIAQPVAQTAPPTPSNPRRSVKQMHSESPSAATNFAQPVAQIDHYALAWSLTLSTLQAIFPDVGTPFLVQLLNSVRSSGFADVTDEELSVAVQRAWNRKRNVQKGEGLFLLTVPDAVRVIRGTPKRDVEAEQRSEFQRQQTAILTMIGKVATILHEKGFDKPAGRLDKLKAEFAGSDPLRGDGMEQLENQMAEIEREAVKLSLANLTPDEKREAKELAKRCAKPYAERMSLDQVAEMENQFMERAALNALGIPRLSLFYV